MALLAVERPLIIGIDDAHWADDGLLDLVEEAAFRLEDAPVLILCTSRPELLDRRPTFGRGARNVDPDRAPAADGRRDHELATVLLKSDSRDLAEGVARASGGNPFFAEEVACRFTDERDRSNGNGRPGTGMPETVQAAIAARLDLLPSDEKRTVQHAAVLGHAFLADALADLDGGAGRRRLSPSSAASRCFTERVAEGGGRFAFRHQLIRDVAYSSLPRAQRAALHARAADGIAGRAGARYPELAELVAYHRMEASSQDPSPKHAESAWHASIEAANVVARRGASGRAQELFEQAVALAPSDVDRLAALRAASHIAIRRFRGDEALRLSREEARLAEEAGEDAAAACAYSQAVEIAARMGGITGDVPLKELEAMLARAEELADPDDLETQTQIRLDHAWIAWRAGRSERHGRSRRRGAGDGAEARQRDDAVERLRRGDRRRVGSLPLSERAGDDPRARRASRERDRGLDRDRGRAQRRSAHDDRVDAPDGRLPRGEGARDEGPRRRPLARGRLLGMGTRPHAELLPR